jgi:cation-transporting ATPase 13A1
MPMKRKTRFSGRIILLIVNPRRGPIDLEAKFEPSLLNTAIYLLGLSQQVSTFAINFQVCHFQIALLNLFMFFVKGRPFREGIRENSALWWGLVAASAVAFSGATDFMPELNRWLQIVAMEDSVRFCLQSDVTVNNLLL